MTTEVDGAGYGDLEAQGPAHPRRQTYIKPRIPGAVWFYGVTSGLVVSSGVALVLLTLTTP